MPEDRTVLDHLLEGRDALQREVQRLTAAIDQLDSVLGRIGSTTRGDGSIGRSDVVGDTGAVAETVAPAAVPGPRDPEPVNSPAEVEPPAPTTVPSRPRAARKAPAKKAARTRLTNPAEPPKSIRVHVLEMLQAENREFGLAEIIDRVHDAGIQAHDDAVRSITIKLMKDGRVERVGRGQYRLARRGSAARASAAVATAPPRVTESAPEPVPAEAPESPSASEPESIAPETPGPVEHAPSTAAQPEWTAVDASPAAEQEPTEPVEGVTDQLEDDQLGADQPAGDQPADDQSAGDQPEAQPADERPDAGGAPYTPSLNLGQPWNS